MSNKLVSRLLSFTLSATVALTSGVPALAYDGGGDLLGEDEEIQLLDEEEVESEEDAPEFEEEVDDIEVVDEESADFLTSDPLGTATIKFAAALYDKNDAAIGSNPFSAEVFGDTINLTASSNDADIVPPSTYSYPGYKLGSTWYENFNSADNTLSYPHTTFQVSDYHDQDDVTYYVKATQIEYTISFDPNASVETGASWSADPGTQAVVIGDAITLPTDSDLTLPTGKRLVGWNTETDGSGVTASASLDAALIAAATGADHDQIKLYAQYGPAATSATSLSINIDGCKTGGSAWKEFTYGAAVSTESLVMVAKDTPVSTPVTYPDVSWTTYVEKKHVTTSDTNPATSAAYTSAEAYAANTATTNLVEFDPDNYNLLVSYSGTGATGSTMTIKNDGSNTAMNIWLAVKVTDTADGSNKVSPYAEVNAIRSDLAVTFDPVNDRSTHVLDFGTAKMGYEVVAADASTDGKTNYVQAEEVAIIATNDRNYKVTDFTYAWDKTDSDWPDYAAFEDVTDDGKGLWLYNERTFTIKPKLNLTNKDDSDKNGVYKAKLLIKHEGWSVARPYYVQFTVKDNLAVSSVIAHGGKEVNIASYESYAGSGLTVSPSGLGLYEQVSTNYVVSSDVTADSGKTYYIPKYDLADINVGSYFEDVVINATGGSGTISFTEYTTGLVLGSTTNPFPTGVEGVPTNAVNSANYKLTGTIDKSALTVTPLTTKSFVLSIKDAIGNAKAVYCTYDIAGYDMSVSVDGKEMKVAKADATNSYSWTAVDGYSKEDAAKNITIINNGDVKVTITATAQVAHDNATASTNATLSTSSLEIGPHGTGTITVTPTAVSTGSCFVKLAGDAVQTTGITMNLTAISDKVAITTPEGNQADTLKSPYYIAVADVIPITAAEVGKQYSYTFEATKSSNVGNVSWSIDKGTNVIDTTNNSSGDTSTITSADLKKYGLTLDESTGVLSGIPTKPTISPLYIRVKADASTNGAATKIVALTIAASNKAFKVSADGKEVKTTEVLDLGTVTLDKIDAFSKIITLSNTTELDMKGIKVSKPNADDYAKFAPVFDDNDTVNDAIWAGSVGFDVAANSDKSIIIKLDDTAAAVGTYTAKLVFTDGTSVPNEYDASGATTSIQFKIKVVDAPIISDSKLTGLKVGTEIKNTDGKRYTVTYGGTDRTSSYTFAWTAGTAPAGLTLGTDGYITGKPEKAGKFEVTVTATNKTDNTVVGVLTHEIEIEGSANITVMNTIGVSTTGATISASNLNGKAILLPGMVAGSASENKAVINMSVSSDENAKNVTVTVEDADDNRPAADIIENRVNPYTGSSNYIGISENGSWASISKGANQSFNIVSKGSPTAGVYKVKITIKGENTNTIVFYAIMVVVDKLVLSTHENISANIGKDYSVAGSEILLTAKGGADVQTIIWSEKGTTVTENGKDVTKFYVTKNGKTVGTGIGASDVTNLELATEADVIGEADDEGLKNEITGELKAAGSFEITLNGEVEAKGYTAGGASSDADNLIYLTDGIIVNKALAGIYPAQKAEAITFTLNSAKSRKVEISNVTFNAGAGERQGQKNGTNYVTNTGFIYNPVTAGYVNTNYPVNVVVSNGDGIDYVAKASLKNGSDSSFTITSSASQTVKKNTPVTFTIVPKANLTKTTHTDTLVISGDNFETVEFALTFTVEDASYLATIDDGNTDTAKRVVYADKNTATGNAVELDSYAANLTPSYEKVTVRNVGNSTINNVAIYESTSDGTKLNVGSSNAMLTVGTLPTSLAALQTREISLTAKKTTAGEFTTYVTLYFEEGTGASAVPHKVTVPVKYTVFGKDLEVLAVDPSGETTRSAEEGYDKADYAVTFTVSNAGSAATDTLVAITKSLTGSDFEITGEAVEALKAGEQATFKVVPKKGLANGTYETTVSFGASNQKSSVSRKIKFTVTESTTYTQEVWTSDADSRFNVGADYVVRLYNSLIGLREAGATSPTITAGVVKNADGTSDADNTGDETHKVTIKFSDGNEVVIVFTGKGALNATKLSEVASATTKSSIELASKSVVLSDKAIEKAKELIGDTGNGTTKPHDAKYFSIINFKFYRQVLLGTTGAGSDATDSESTTTTDVGGGVLVLNASTLFNAKAADLENDYVKTKWEYAATSAANYKAYKDYAYGVITAWVPYGSTIGSVFNDGELPTTIKAGQVMVRWESGGNTVNKNTVVRNNISFTEKYHKHQYAPVTETNEKFVKWDWTKDEKGNLSVVLHLFCTEEECPDYAASEIVIDGTAKTAANGTLEYGDRKVTEATCEKAAGYTYLVTAKVNKSAINISGGGTQDYDGKYVEEQSGEPLGHKYDVSNPAKVVWNDANNDKKITADEIKITRACVREGCGHIEELEVVSVQRNAEKSLLPTCTKAGYDVMSITYKEITEAGAFDKEVTIDYNKGEKFVVPATGHSEEVEVIVTDFDKETKKGMVTLKCKNENCDATDHIVFGPAEVTFTDAGSETYTAQLTLTDATTRTITYVNDVFYNATVNWTKKFETKYTKGTGLPAIEYTITYTSKNSGKSVTTDAIAATVTADKDYSAESTEKEITFTATADLSGYYKDKEATTAATADPLTITYKFKNGGLYGTSGQEIGGDMIVEGLEDEYFYTGAPIKPTMVVTDGDMVLAEGVDYSVEYKNNKKISSKGSDGEYTKTAQVTVKGKGNYAGQGQTLYFAIIDPKDEVKEDDMALKGYSIKLPKEDHIYTGEAQYPSYIIIKKGKTELTYEHQGDGAYANTEGEIPAVVTFSNNVNKGAATVCLTGTDKSIKKTFQIKAATFNGDFEVSVDESVAWAVKGAQPTVGIAWNGAELVPGQDFKVSYSKNKAIGTATAKITGKGNFKGKLEKSFSVVALPLTEANVAGATAVDGKKISNVVVLDNEGNTINKKNYTVTVLDETGADVTKAKLAAGKEYTLVIKAAKDVVATDEDGVSVTVKAGYNLAKAKVDAKSVSKTYTGEAIELDADDMAKIKVTYSGKALEFGTDYEIAGYTNNIKKGNMKVTIRGIGEFSGSKTFKVKIAPKPIAATN